MGNIEIVLNDRIQWMAVLIVACFVAVLLLSRQSRASYPTYALAILMLATIPRWYDVFRVSLVHWILALLLWLCLSTLWSDPYVFRDAMSVWIRALLVFFFVVAFAECQVRGQLRRWMGFALTLSGVVVVVIAIAVFFISDPADGRLNGLGQLDTHVIAALVYGVVGIFVLQTLLDEKKQSVRLLCWVALTAILIAIALSDSRNAWVSVTFGLGSLLLASRVEDARAFTLAVITLAGLIAISLGLLVLNPDLRELLLPRGASFRPEIWATVLDRVLDQSLLIGRGIISAADVIGPTRTFDHPHNMYLAILDQGGLVGLLLYVGVLLKSIKLLLANYHSVDAKLALGILAIGLSAHLLDGHELIDKIGSSWFLIWLPVGVALGFGWLKTERT